MSEAEARFDAIVIGSGIGGLGAAAALAKVGKRVLVLEQHFLIGGLTQSFMRGGYEFGCGVHYVGGAGSEPGAMNRFGRLLGWLTDDRLQFAAIGSPYDVVKLPEFEFSIRTPRDAYIADLKRAFPEDVDGIDAYFEASASADAATRKMFAARALPKMVSAIINVVNESALRKGLNTKTADSIRSAHSKELADLITARWALCGMPPQASPLAAHSLATTSLYENAYYPVGGPARFAQTLGKTVSDAGGVLRARARVTRIRVENGTALGVELASGETIDAPVVISAMGAHNTALALPNHVAPAWAASLTDIQPGDSYVCLYLGFNADIREYGAGAANIWIYESNDVGRVWENPGKDPVPNLFVSFPSVKDPENPNPLCHTAEVLTMVPWTPFESWAGSVPGKRPEPYRELKARIEEQLLERFSHHFPDLAPFIDFHELSTPLTQAYYTGASRGAMYGLGMTAERLRHPALRVRTPVQGLLLAGQDATGPGLNAAFIGGYMAAASVEPSLWKHMNS